MKNFLDTEVNPKIQQLIDDEKFAECLAHLACAIRDRNDAAFKEAKQLRELKEASIGLKRSK